jgi:hypothetical protein
LWAVVNKGVGEEERGRGFLTDNSNPVSGFFD